jgi:SAM-dependent methyltransferase
MPPPNHSHAFNLFRLVQRHGIAPGGRPMTHEETIARWIPPGAIGTEIGPGTTPLPISTPRPIYVDCFKRFGDAPCQADFYGHACHLPFHDHSLDFVASSHVLEHVANPVAALAEWYRVVRPGGIIYLVVPDRRATWEHQRALTGVEHFLADYLRGTTSCDPTHIDEFVYDADWSRYSPSTAPEQVAARQKELAHTMHWAVSNGEEINIHFHTFELGNLRGLLETLAVWPARRFNWELVDAAEHFPASNPNGVLAVLRVNKGWRARAEADWFRLAANGDGRAAIRADAQPFAAWAEQTPGLGGVR